MDDKYLKDAEALVKKLEREVRRLRTRIDDIGFKNIATLHNQVQVAVSIAVDLEVTVAVHRRVIKAK